MSLDNHAAEKRESRNGCSLLQGIFCDLLNIEAKCAKRLSNYLSTNLYKVRTRSQPKKVICTIGFPFFHCSFCLGLTAKSFSIDLSTNELRSPAV